LKKGTKALSNFNSIELGQVFQALHMHRKTLRYMDKLLFDITFIKLARQKDLESFRTLEFDGMEMRTMSEALKFRGKNLIKHKNYLAAVKYFLLAQGIEEEMYQFQKLNGPQVGPQTEKAPTARTVSAGYKII